ncbi:hypothetical protein MKW92_034725, partial [Papaver armeniacum]
IEITKAKPVTHRFDKARGKLRVTQASISALGGLQYLVKCSVGGQPPITLCNLSSETNYSCSLDIEFDEEDGEVVFSIDGHYHYSYDRDSVHLSGYYIKERNKGKLVFIDFNIFFFLLGKDIFYIYNRIITYNK